MYRKHFFYHNCFIYRGSVFFLNDAGVYLIVAYLYESAANRDPALSVFSFIGNDSFAEQRHDGGMVFMTTNEEAVPGTWQGIHSPKRIFSGDIICRYTGAFIIAA